MHRNQNSAHSHKQWQRMMLILMTVMMRLQLEPPSSDFCNMAPSSGHIWKTAHCTAWCYKKNYFWSFKDSNTWASWTVLNWLLKMMPSSSHKLSATPNAFNLMKQNNQENFSRQLKTFPDWVWDFLMITQTTSVPEGWIALLRSNSCPTLHSNSLILHILALGFTRYDRQIALFFC